MIKGIRNNDDWDRPPRSRRDTVDDWLTLGHKFATYIVCAFVIGGSVPAWNLLTEMNKSINEVKLVTSAAAAAQAVRDSAQNDAMKDLEKWATQRMNDSDRRLSFMEARVFGRTQP